MSRCAMTARRTTTSYALLGLLALRPWTTYELAKQVQRSLNWFWPRAERKLYDEPKRLVAAGLASARAEANGKRPRTVYDITPAGREELRRWLGEPPAPRTGEFEAMVKLFFADQGDLGQLVATLDRVAAEAEERLAALGAMAGRSEDLPFPSRSHISALGLAYQVGQERAVLAWAEWAREQVALWPAADDPGQWDPRAVLDELVAQDAGPTGRA